MCLIGFKYLWGEWSNAESPPMGVGEGNVRATIFFLFLLVGTWVIIVLYRFFELFFLNFTEFLILNTDPYFWFIRLVVHILLTNASNKELTLHLHQHMNQIQLPINIQAIRSVMKLISTMSLHFQMLDSNSKEVI